MGGDGASADSDFDFDDGGLDDALLASLALPNDLLREQGGGGGGSGDVRAQPLTTARDDSPRDGAKHSPAASAFALKRPTSRLSMKAKPSPRGTAKPSPRSTAKPSSPRQLTLEAAFKRPLVLQQTSSAASTPRPVTTARPTKTQLKPLCDVDLDTDGSVVVIDEESDANAENQRPLSTSKANHFAAYAFQPPDSGYRQSEIIQQPQNVAQRPLQLSNNHTVDEEACRTWIYPTNYPVRSYQLNIVGKALFHNMLVSLPTGLGKTFIAAVVMYNYWRWFPKGKVIFMAPTKPLVAQQIEACHSIVGMPQSETAELTGAQQVESRAQTWLTKRVFFLTPQVMQNDLQRGSCPLNDVVCLVVDEAHRATGNHAYCEVVREVSAQNPNFRILALSATPGSDTKAVQAVVSNLHISRIEIRTEESIDIREYTHVRKKEVVVVPLGDRIHTLQRQFCDQVLVPILQRLRQAQAMFDVDPMSLGGYMLLQARGQWRMRRAPTMDRKMSGVVEKNFAVLISLYHAFEVLQKHGISPFHGYLSVLIRQDEKGQAVKGANFRNELIANAGFMEMMRVIETEMKLPTYVGHPKLSRLENTVLTHFLEHDEIEAHVAEGSKRESRVMVFSEFRDSVDEIVKILNRNSPILRATPFVGQATKNGKGLSQREQLDLIEKFKTGHFNILVATSIGEEGLDIGDIDMIICFDSQSSPIRMLQRMGRTGRKREGKIVVLLSEGKEQQKYNKAQAQYKSIQNAIQNQDRQFKLWPQNPKMLPDGPHGKPTCVQMKVAIAEYVHAVRKAGRGGKSIEGAPVATDPCRLDPAQAFEYRELFGRDPDNSLEDVQRAMDFSRGSHWNTVLLPAVHVQHNDATSRFVDCKMNLEQYLADDRRGRAEGKSVEEMSLQWRTALELRMDWSLVAAVDTKNAPVIEKKKAAKYSLDVGDNVPDGENEPKPRKRKPVRKSLTQLMTAKSDEDTDSDSLQDLATLLRNRKQSAKPMLPVKISEADVGTAARNVKEGKDRPETDTPESLQPTVIPDIPTSEPIFERKSFTRQPYARSRLTPPKTPFVLDLQPSNVSEFKFDVPVAAVELEQELKAPTPADCVSCLDLLVRVLGSEPSVMVRSSAESSDKQPPTVEPHHIESSSHARISSAIRASPATLPQVAATGIDTIALDRHSSSTPSRIATIASPEIIHITDDEESFGFDDNSVLLDINLDAGTLLEEEHNVAPACPEGVPHQFAVPDPPRYSTPPLNSIAPIVVKGGTSKPPDKKRLSLKLNRDRRSPIFIRDPVNVDARKSVPPSPMVAPARAPLAPDSHAQTLAAMPISRSPIPAKPVERCADSTPRPPIPVRPVERCAKSTPAPVNLLTSEKPKSGRKRSRRDVVIFSSPADVMAAPLITGSSQKKTSSKLRRLFRGDQRSTTALKSPATSAHDVPARTRRLRKTTVVVRRGTEHIAAERQRDKEARVEAGEPKPKKKKKRTRSAALHQFQDLEAGVSDGSISDKDGNRLRYQREGDDDLDEGDIDELYADDSELDGFVVDDDEDESHVGSSVAGPPPVFRSPAHGAAFGMGGRYKMKFAGGITLSQKYVHNQPDGSSELDESFVSVGSEITIDERLLHDGSSQLNSNDEDLSREDSACETDASDGGDGFVESPARTQRISVHVPTTANLDESEDDDDDDIKLVRVARHASKRKNVIIDEPADLSASQASSVAPSFKKHCANHKKRVTGTPMIHDYDEEDTVFKKPLAVSRTPSRAAARFSIGGSQRTSGLTQPTQGFECSVEMPNFSLGFNMDALMDGVDTTVFDDLVDDDDDDDDAVRRAPTSLDLPPVVAPPPPPPRTSLNEERPNTDRVASPMNKLLAGALHTRLQSVPSLPKPSMAQRPATFNAPASEHVAQISTDGKLTILVDSRELKTPICSLLRNKYQLNTVVRQLAVADYIVSNRVGVERKARSDLLKSVYNKRLHEQITSLTVMYEIPVLIIEDEPVPLGGGGMRGMQTENANKQSQFEGVVASLMRYDRLRVLQSKDKAETAKLLSDLAQMELQQGAKILVPTLIPEKKHQALQFVLSIPGVSYVTAWNIVAVGGFTTIKEIVNAGMDDFVARVPNLTRGKATKIMDHFTRVYEGGARADCEEVSRPQAIFDWQ